MCIFQPNPGLISYPPANAIAKTFLGFLLTAKTQLSSIAIL
ncbi:hypothetical protein [Nostoc sp. PA-18-2419]|nr:hypothetical protein [Nostoc sp. PA-18-2419]